MEAIRNVLVHDASGRPSTNHRLVASSEWDDIRQWSDKVYMPYDVMPIGKARRPDSVLDATRIGHFTLSRFKYGIPVNIKDFSPEAGTGMVLTTLRGSAFESFDEFGRIGHLDAGFAHRRLADAKGNGARRDVDAEIGRFDHLQRLLLRLHDVG
ncbi:MAG: hypothetical protein IH617_13555, partial [Hydrogenophaga sp.]|nr:hypothetical protein [Hydrogenophaga sp.]